jgi:signal peptidase II
MLMTRSQTKSILPYLTLIAVAFAADQLSKQWAGAYWAAHGQTTFSRLFTLYVVYNPGIGLGLLPGSGAVIGWLTLLIVALLLIWLERVPRSQWLVKVGLALILGGALGNMVDRLWAGQVLDFILTPLWPRILNIADIAIRGGAVVVLAGAFFGEGKVTG